jgi:hypothetical protein
MNHRQRPLRRALLILAVSAGIAPAARGVITISDPGRNTTAPTDPALNSLWDLEGGWRGFIGTPIAPHYFVTAEHVGGGAGDLFGFAGKLYTATAVYDDPNTDLRIVHVNGTLPTFATLYTGSSEAGKTAFIVGHGTQRGDPVVAQDTLAKGWKWGPGDGVQSWGQNVIDLATGAGAGFGDVIAYDFDANGIPNEATVSAGDSGGGVFINDNGTWKLAGVTLGVDAGPFSITGDPHDPGFQAAIYDKRGLYGGGTFNPSTGTYTWNLISNGIVPQPTLASASRISTNLSFINNTLAIPEPTWNVNAGGTWSNPGNWVGGVPNGADAEANFGAAISLPRTVTLNAPFTVGTLNFNNGTASYTIGGTSTLTIAASVGTGGAINVLAGNHAISAPLQLNSNTTLNVTAASASLTISGPLSIAPGVALTKAGAGAAQVNVVRADSLAINGGTLRIAPSGGSTAGTSNVKSLSIAGTTNAWTGRLDLADNSLAVDYTGTSPIATIANQLKSGYASGSWSGNGIASSTAASAAGSAHKTALGVAEATDLFTSFPASFRGQSVDNTSVLVRYTASGDANLDGVVDTLDFNSLAANFGKSGQRWSKGDFNYDGVVDTLDFNSLAANFGFAVTTTSSPSEANSLGTVVPEPTTIGALSLGAAALLVRRRFRVS